MPGALARRIEDADDHRSSRARHRRSTASSSIDARAKEKRATTGPLLLCERLPSAYRRCWLQHRYRWCCRLRFRCCRSAQRRSGHCWNASRSASRCRNPRPSLSQSRFRCRLLYSLRASPIPVQSLLPSLWSSSFFPPFSVEATPAWAEAQGDSATVTQASFHEAHARNAILWRVQNDVSASQLGSGYARL